MSATILHGECIAEMAAMPEASIDAIVTDPPYGLGFMGKRWDGLPPGEDWARECLRVLRPGGHMLAFGGTRTWHRLAVAVEDAGFEIRDSIAWLYGSGFPKSLDVSKAIDKAGGASPADQATVLRSARERAGMSREDVARSVGGTPSSVRDWEEGRARAKGRAVEFVTPSTAYREKLADLLGYTADERQIVGVGGGARSLYESGHRGIAYGGPNTTSARVWQGWGTALKPAHEPIIVARKPLAGTVAANVLEHGTGALNIDGCRIEGAPWTFSHSDKTSRSAGVMGNTSGARQGVAESHPAGRWPANVVLDEDQAAALDAQSGQFAGVAGGMRQTEGKVTFTVGEKINDYGGASRFFYCAKASKSERPVVDGVAHPTVKPLSLMRWLVRLVTPPGGTVLDPFAGSGTTVEAAILEGFDVIGIEQEAEYLPLIQARLDRAGGDTPRSPAVDTRWHPDRCTCRACAGKTSRDAFRPTGEAPPFAWAMGCT